MDPAWLQSGVGSLRSAPVILLLLPLLPLLALMICRVFPDRRLAMAVLVPLALSLAVVLRPGVWPLVLAADLVIVLVAAVDLLSLPRQRDVRAGRRVVKIAALAKRHAVTLSLDNLSGRQLRVRVRDDLPPEFSARPEEFSAVVPPGNRIELAYQFQAGRRGAFPLAGVHLLARSRLGWWQRSIFCPAASTVHVYPDLQQLAEYALLARTNRLSLMGVRRTRRIGQDHDFERLRDYALDDNYKHIDWRATARRYKLTVKEFQTSQSQRLVFLLDCGRMMTNLSGGLSLLDYSLNAALLLSYVALRQGDAVGLICFSDEVHGYVPPRGGMRQMNQLLHACFDRFPRLVESRYDKAFLYLATHCKKRSLVVLLTNVIDEVNAHQVQRYLSSLVGRHLPLGVLLRDHRLFDAVPAGDPASEEELYTAAAAAQILTWRHQVLTDLAHQGVLSLDVFPEQLTAPLVNRYLEIKARHLL